jgi:hypothetical protein
VSGDTEQINSIRALFQNHLGAYTQNIGGIIFSLFFQMITFVEN